MGHIAVMDMLSPTLAFIDGLGAPEMLLIFVLVLVLFGGQKLPEFARGLGKTVREFKKAAAGVEEEFKRALDEDERKQNAAKLETTSTPALPAPAVTDPAGPGTSPQYDEYGHEIYDVPATPAEAPAPAATAPVTDAATPAAAPSPATPASPETPPAVPAPATPAVSNPASPTPSTSASPAVPPPAPPAPASPPAPSAPPPPAAPPGTP